MIEVLNCKYTLYHKINPVVYVILYHLKNGITGEGEEASRAAAGMGAGAWTLHRAAPGWSGKQLQGW